MLIAEELEVDVRRVKVEAAAGGRGVRASAGRHPVHRRQPERRDRVGPLPQGGRGGREMLLAAAAQTWGVDRASLRAENGRVLGPRGRALTYGQLVDRARTQPVPSDPPLKDPSQFKIIGKPTRRLDSREKVTGTATFGLDASVPGMLIAVIARPPVFGATVKSVDDAGREGGAGREAGGRGAVGGRGGGRLVLVRQEGPRRPGRGVERGRRARRSTPTRSRRSTSVSPARPARRRSVAGTPTRHSPARRGG